MADHGHAHGSGGHAHSEACSHGHGGAHGSEAGHDGSESAGHAAAAHLPLLRPDSRPAESLTAEFMRAEALYHHIQDGTPIPDCDGDGSAAAAAGESSGRLPHDNNRHAADALDAFLRVAQMIRRESIFSGDESLADVQTAHLPLLLAEFYIARLRQQAPASAHTPGDMARTRLTSLRTARGELEGFLAQALSLRGLVPADEAKAIGLADMAPYLAEVYGGSFARREGAGVGGGSGFSGVGGDGSGGLGSSLRARRAAEDAEEAESARDYSTIAAKRAGAAAAIAGAARVGPRIDPSTARMQKIERFKRSAAGTKRLRELAAIHARRVEAARRRGMDVSAALEAAELDGIGGSGSGAGSAAGTDEESRREMAILALQGAVRQALDDLASLAQELPLLAHMVAAADERDRAGAAAGGAGAGAGSAGGDGRARDRGAAAGGAGAGDAAAAADGRPSDFSGRTGPPPGDPSIDPSRKGLVSRLHLQSLSGDGGSLAARFISRAVGHALLAAAVAA